ncbi:hypothetical protein [Methanococcus sp. CF]
MDFTLILTIINQIKQNLLYSTFLLIFPFITLILYIPGFYKRLNIVFEHWIFSSLVVSLVMIFFNYVALQNISKEYLIYSLSIMISVLTASKQKFDKYTNLKSIKDDWIDVLNKFNGYFKKSIKLKLINFGTFERKEEYAILDTLLRNNGIKNKQELDSLKLCYYCKKSENESDEHSRSKVLQLSESLGIINAKNLGKTETFLNIYHNLKNNLDWKTNSITPETYDMALEEFMDCQELNKKHLEIKKEYLEVLSSFESYFGKNILLNKSLPKDPKKKSETDILEYFLKNNNLKANLRNSIILCYLCKKRDLGGTVSDSGLMEYSSRLGLLDYTTNELDIDTRVDIFLRVYFKLIYEKTNILLNKDGSDIIMTQNISGEAYSKLLAEFIEKYFPMYRLIQVSLSEHESTKNLHSKLRELIVEGRLSKYGIDKSIFDRIDEKISNSGKVSNSFLVLVKSKSNTMNIFKKGFTDKLVRISAAGKNSKNIQNENLKGIDPSMHVIKWDLGWSPEDILEHIKKELNLGSETGISIIPLDFSKGVLTIFPEDNTVEKDPDAHKFIELINYLNKNNDLVEKQSISELFSELNDKMPINDLLSLIPFNLFCNDILDVEEKYFDDIITEIKNKFKIEKLGDWARQDPERILQYLIKHAGYPDYSGVNFDDLDSLGINLDDKISKELRFKKLCTEIIEKSKEYAEALK